MLFLQLVPLYLKLEIMDKLQEGTAKFYIALFKIFKSFVKKSIPFCIDTNSCVILRKAIPILWKVPTNSEYNFLLKNSFLKYQWWWWGPICSLFCSLLEHLKPF